MTKLALAMIVKGSDLEAQSLQNCLESIAPHVDGIFITITQPNEKVQKVAEFFGAQISHFEWCNDFAAARNFNFSQVTKDFTHILWLDADDTVTGGEHLRDIIKENPGVDIFALLYAYHFDKYGMCDVAHWKTQLVKNDGCVTWKGSLHENFDNNRDVSTFAIEPELVLRVHHTTDERVAIASERNVQVALIDVAANPKDPRSYWNLGNSFFGAGKHEQSLKTFTKFLEMSQSEDEKYVALLRMAESAKSMGDDQKAIEYYQMAIGKKPKYPDAYYNLGQLYCSLDRWEEALESVAEGLTKQPPTKDIIVFNPRDYDYNPLMLMAKIYWELNAPEHSLIALQACKKIYPKNEALDNMIKIAQEETDTQKIIKGYVAKVEEAPTNQEKKEIIAQIPEEYWEHPMVCYLRNNVDIKDTSSGKEVTYFCGNTTHEWNPDTLKVGVGGSEEAVIHLSRQLAKKGYEVTVYNNCGKGGVWDGVTYKPWYLYNARAKTDITILWRQARSVDWGLNSDKIFIDVHDVIKAGEFNEERLKKITKIMVKSQAHREIFPEVHDDKIAIVPNGIVPDDFKKKPKRDPYLIINTSSPDRSLSAFSRIFKKIKEIEPKAKAKWAYGFGVFDATHKNDKDMMAWKASVLKQAEEAGVEVLGKISHAQIANLTLTAGVFLYPTTFYEIDCISARKAQLGGCIPVTSDFAALKTTNEKGIKVHSSKTKDDWCPPYTWDFGDKENDPLYVEAAIEMMRNPIDREPLKEWAKGFNWESISNQWEHVLR